MRTGDDRDGWNGYHIGQFYFLSKAEYESVLARVVDSGWYTNHGPEASQLERELSEYLGVNHSICVSNATLGLTMAIEALGYSGRILTSAVSFPATLFSAQFVDLPICLVDVNIRTGHIDIDGLWRLAEPGDLILCPNLYGGAASVGEIVALAEERKCGLIFDSAGGLGTRFEASPLGSFGDCEVFSLHATKIVSCGEGGFITTNDDALASRLRSIRSSYGNSNPVKVRRTANGRLSEIQAGCARESLRKLEVALSQNFALLETYGDGFGEVPELIKLELSPGVRGNGSSCSYLVDGDSKLSAGELVRYLHTQGIRARQYYNPPLYGVPFPGNRHQTGADFPVARDFLERIFQLPVGGQMTVTDVEFIVESVKRWLYRGK